MSMKVPMEVAVFVVELLSAVLNSKTKQEAARAAMAVASKAASEKAIKAALK